MEQRTARRDIVVIGGSAGGVEAVTRIVAALPAGLPAALFVVIHIPATAVSALPRILSRAGPLRAEHATSGDPIQQGRIVVAPPDRHLLVGREEVYLSTAPREHGHRPSADVLFRSAAQHHGPRVIGVVLSGLLGDGATGLARIVQRGGVGVVQDPAESAYSSMPERAVEVAAPQHVVPLVDVAPLIVELVGAGAPARTASERIPGRNGPAILTHSVTAEEMVKDEQTAIGDDRPGTPTGYSCPDCGGVLWERGAPLEPELVCRIGHRYTLESLVEVKNAALEGALWASVRALEEQVSLLRRLADSQATSGGVTGRFEELAADNQRQAELIRGLLERRD